MKNLYVIGNGFDLSHLIPSRYSDFEIFLREVDENLINKIEKYINPKDLWSDFEESLSHIDVDQIVDDASQFLVSYGADDWSDAYHHDYGYEVDEVLKSYTTYLKKRFTEWILSLNVDVKPKVKFSEDSFFISFNYTSTLENAYQIPGENIMYIHGKADGKDSDLILGHSYVPTDKDLYSQQNNMETDVRVADANEQLDDYFKETFKNTETIIQKNTEKFDQLSEIENIYILGHSLSKVDLEYFKKIYSKVTKKAIWNVSYYSDSEKDSKKSELIKLGVHYSRINIIKIDELMEL